MVSSIVVRTTLHRFVFAILWALKWSIRCCSSVDHSPEKKSHLRNFKEALLCWNFHTIFTRF